MLRKGQRLVCTVESLGYQGEGICKPDGIAVFVPFSLPGETIEIEIEKTAATHAFARLLNVILPSEKRQAPPCGAFFRCGGCTAQHMPYETQLDFKRQAVQSSLLRIAKTDLKVELPIGTMHPWEYRNKTSWQFRGNGAGIKMGFFGIKSHDLVETASCEIAKPVSAQAARLVRDWFAKQNTAAGTKAIDGLPITQVVTRVSSKGQLMVSLVTGAGQITDVEALASKLQAAIPGFHSLHVMNKTDNEQADADYSTICGESSLMEEIGGLRFNLSPASFFQVNHEICQKLYQYAIGQAGRKNGGVLFDVYSGTGTLSLLAAARFKQVYGLELSAAAVKDAKDNAVLNHVNNAAFIQGYAEEELPRLVQSGIRADCVILDPPRSGAQKAVLEAIIKAQPERVVYISCHPPSQARDTAILVQGGYVPIKAQPFDMFSQTPEIENVITFTRSAE